MTNEEAIKRLKEAYYNSDYMREPIQMAIEALKTVEAAEKLVFLATEEQTDD